MRRKFGWKHAVLAAALLAAVAAFGAWLISFVAYNTRVPLPDDLALTAPGNEIAPEIAAFSGVWAGDRWDGVLPHALAVERLAADGAARVVFAWGTDRKSKTTHDWIRLDAWIVGGHLTMTLPNHNVVDYVVLPNGRLLGRSTSPADWRGYVILKRIDAPNLAQAVAVAAKRSDPLWQETEIPEHSRVGAAAGRTLSLQTTIYRSQFPGRRPLIILNHGTSGALRPGEVYRYEPQARFFLSLGYSVAVPMRKGRGDSGGPLIESEDFKAPPQVEIDSGIEDIDTVAEYMKTQPYVDSARIVVAGQQRGGLLAAVYAARYPGKVSGAINFSGGWWPEAIQGGAINTEAFTEAGRGAKVSMLWLYAEGDPYYSRAHIERNFTAFRAAGGKGRLVEVPDPGAVKAYGNDLFLWTAKWEGDVLDYLSDDVRPAWDAGLRLAQFGDPLSEGPMEGAVFYPSPAPAGDTDVGIWTLDARGKAPLADGRFPLILFSHDYGGSRFSQYDSASYLARRGFIVMTVTHPGDNPRDYRGWRTDRALIGREYDLRAVLDDVLANPELGSHIDRERIGVVGHGLGGYTALLLAGAIPDLSRFVSYCRDPSIADPTCENEKGPPLIRAGLEVFREHRIKAAFLEAPGPGYFFEREGLHDVTVPIHIDDPTDDRVMKRPYDAERIRDLLPTPPEYAELKDAGHDIFLAPCPKLLSEAKLELCTDPPGIDRVAMHLKINAAMADFFRRTLAVP